MTVKTWMATHTGLPSFYSDSPVKVISPDGRILADGSKPVCISDALAVPGVAGEYLVGDKKVVLTRPGGRPGDAVVSRLNGRRAAGVRIFNNEDPLSWDSEVARFDSGAVRWPLEPQRLKGKSYLGVVDPENEPGLLSVLQEPGPIIIGPGLLTEGVPLRVVTVTSLSRSRPHATRIFYEVEWEEFSLKRMRSAGVAPLVTWGEWQAHDGGWTHKSYLQLAREIAGMPA